MEVSSPSEKCRRRPKPANAASQLHLTSLPRFHPANYNNSTSSSMDTTPNSLSPNPSLSPRTTVRYFDPDQRQQLSYYHQHLLAQSTMGTNSTSANTSGKKPSSPKLVPITGSPGPVTPLELEGDNYIVAGTKSSPTVDSVLREDAKRRGDSTRRINS
jgi:hypothetical protein